MSRSVHLQKDATACCTLITCADVSLTKNIHFVKVFFFKPGTRESHCSMTVVNHSAVCFSLIENSACAVLVSAQLCTKSNVKCATKHTNSLACATYVVGSLERHHFQHHGQLSKATGSWFQRRGRGH